MARPYAPAHLATRAFDQTGGVVQVGRRHDVGRHAALGVLAPVTHHVGVCIRLRRHLPLHTQLCVLGEPVRCHKL